MGQEIVHCSACGVRLRSADFDRGGALRADGYAYCQPCALQTGVTPDPAPSRSSQNATRRIAKVAGTSTSRIPIATPRQATPAVPAPSVSPVLLWGGVSLGTIVVVSLGLLLAGGSRTQAPSSSDPAPSRVAARTSPARTDAPPPAAPAAPKSASSTAESADLASLERRVADLVARERFREALGALESERKLHDSLEWSGAVQRSVLGVDAAAKKLYQDLQGKLEDARRRGADGEIRALADRIATWGLPAYPPVPDAPLAAAPATAPAPAAPAAPSDPAPAPAAPAEPIPAPPLPPKAAPAQFVPGPMKWSILTPLRATASPGTVLRILEDGSILAEGDPPKQDRYAIVVRTDQKLVHALRLEILPDPSLPASGPGRAFNGNFVLSEFQLQVLPDDKAPSGTPVAIERAAAEHSQDGFPIANVIDGRADTGWAILPLVGRPVDAVFDLRAPLSSQGPLTLLVVLDHASIHEQHELGRFRLSVSPVKGASSEIALRPPPAVDQAPVDAAIRNGVEWLKRNGSPGWDSGNPKVGRIPNCDELLLLTFIHSGVPENDTRFQQLLASVLAAPYTHTYPVALRAMALEELDRVRYQPQIARCAQFLLDSQLQNGQWSYGEPSVAVDAIRADIPAATAAARPGSRPKPKVVQKINVRQTRTLSGNGDFSNSSYAALGLRACVDSGIVLPKEVLARASQAISLAQLSGSSKKSTATLASGREPRGWCYDSPCACPNHRIYGGMTAGALSALAIYDHLLGRDGKKDAAILDGLAWLQVNYAVDAVPGPVEFDKATKTTFLMYYLYALERAMILTGNERVGPYAWYADGVRFLLGTQKPDGSWALDDWSRDTWDTCFALLFLKRSTRPLVASSDRLHSTDDEKK